MSYKDIAKWASEQVGQQAQVTYEDYKKIKGFEDVGYLLQDYVISGGEVTADSLRNDTVDVSEIVVSLNGDVMRRDGTSFKVTVPSSTYFIDFTAEGDWNFGTAHAPGIANEDYLTIAEVVTTSAGLVGSIVDKRGHVGGTRFKDEYGLEDYAKKAVVDAQLADTAEGMKKIDDRRFHNNLISYSDRKPMITIIDDDSRNDLYTRLYPIMVEYNLPFTSAVITGRVGNNSETITKAQYDEMLESGLVDFISHTKRHVNLTEMTLAAAEKEMIESKNWVFENGGNPDYFVPPFGNSGVNADINKLIRKYFKGSFVTKSAYQNKPPINTFEIARSDFEQSLETQKLRIDSTKTNNRWLIINTHAHYSSFSESDYRYILDYALSQGLEFVTVTEGMKHYGNLLEFGVIGSEGYGGIDADGVLFGSILPQVDAHIRESLSLNNIVIPANSNISANITPTKMSISNSKVYVLTPTTNPQGVVYTWSIDPNGRIVFRFNNLTSNELTISFSFNFAESPSTTG